MIRRPATATLVAVMNHTTQIARAPKGDPLEPEALARLRALLVEHGIVRLSITLGVSTTALARAAAGLRVLRGTRELVRQGLDQLASGLESGG